MESKNAEKNSPIFKIKRKRLVSNKINVLELEPQHYHSTHGSIRS